MKQATTTERELIEISRDYKVTKSNDLIQKCRYSLTLQEQKIVAYLVSRIQPEDTELKEYTFELREFCRVCDIQTDGMYKNLKETTLSLRNKGFDVTIPNGNITTVSWIAKRTYNTKQGTITLKFDEDLKPYLLQLKEKFTSYELYYLLAFKSKYSIRIYELLKSYINLKYYQVTIENFRNLIDVADKYQQYKEFKRNVLDTAIKEINKTSDIRVTYTTEKKGKKIVKLIFTIKNATITERIETRATEIKELKKVVAIGE